MRLLKSIFGWRIRDPEIILYKEVGRSQKIDFRYYEVARNIFSKKAKNRIQKDYNVVILSGPSFKIFVTKFENKAYSRGFGGDLARRAFITEITNKNFSAFGRPLILGGSGGKVTI